MPLIGAISEILNSTHTVCSCSDEIPGRFTGLLDNASCCNWSICYDNFTANNSSGSASASIDTAQVQFYSKIRKEADIRSFMVGLRNSTDSKAYCAGVLVSSLYVLTSNLCGPIMTSNGEAWQYASIGSMYDCYTGMGEVIRVSWRYAHPDYEPYSHDNDFMLLRLADHSKQIPVRLPDADSQLFTSGKNRTVFGWNSGDPSINQTDSAYMFVIKMNWTECSKVMTLQSQYCAIDANETDACHTSLGSPMDQIVQPWWAFSAGDLAAVRSTNRFCSHECPKLD